MQLYRWMFMVLGVSTLFWLAGPTHAAQFTAETMLERLGKKQRVRLYVKGSWIREEMKDAFGQKQVFVSVGSRKNQTFVLYPEKRSYMVLPAIAAVSPIGNNQETFEKIGRRRLVGQEFKEGYLCDKYEIVFRNKYRGKMYQWVARRLNYTIQMIQTDCPVPFRWELENIKEVFLPSTLFEIPKGYSEIKKPVQGFCGAGICVLGFY